MLCTLHLIYMRQIIFENLRFGTYFEYLKFSIPHVLICECFLNVGGRLLPFQLFIHEIFRIKIILN
jgi:hypothetical protein